MNFKEIIIDKDEALELEQFKEMDYFAVKEFDLPIELMMENAGLQLANLIASSCSHQKTRILVGVGNGNNGGGGLVAARRLAAWGYHVYLDIFTDINKELPLKQLNRARKFGVSQEPIKKPDLWVDAYLGFSQRLPLSSKLINRIGEANRTECERISLDIPTGFLGNPKSPYFQASKVLTLAASKKVLNYLPTNVSIFVADLGIPHSVYQKFGLSIPPFESGNVLKIMR